MSNPDKAPPHGSSLLRRVQVAADVSDRWFLSLASGFVRIGDWAGREAGLAADSAVAAFTTTVEVTKRLAGSRDSPRELRTPPNPVGSFATKASAAAPELELLSATPASSTPPEQGIIDVPVASPAGMVPVVQALGRVVSEYDPRGYSALQHDERFWVLCGLLDSLRDQNSHDPDDPGNSSSPDDLGELTSTSENERKP